MKDYLEKDINKVVKSIDSCKTAAQLSSCEKLIDNLMNLYSGRNMFVFSIAVHGVLNVYLKNIKNKLLIENYSN